MRGDRSKGGVRTSVTKEFHERLSRLSGLWGAYMTRLTAIYLRSRMAGGSSLSGPYPVRSYLHGPYSSLLHALVPFYMFDLHFATVLNPEVPKRVPKESDFLDQKALESSAGLL